MSIDRFPSTNFPKSKSFDNIVGSTKKILQSLKPIHPLILISDDGLKIKDLLDMQKLELHKTLTLSKSTGSLESYESLFYKRAKAKLAIDLELLFKKTPVLTQLAEMHYATNRNFITLEAFYKILQECGLYETIIPLLASISAIFINKQGLLDYSGFLECLSTACTTPSPDIRSPKNLPIPVLPTEKAPLPPVGYFPEEAPNWTEKRWEKFYLGE